MSQSLTAMWRIALPVFLALGLAMPVRAEDDPADSARSAAAALAAAIDSLDAATGAQDRVAALTLTIRAYEDGLAAAREALRIATVNLGAEAVAFRPEDHQWCRPPDEAFDGTPQFSAPLREAVHDVPIVVGQTAFEHAGCFQVA